MARKNFNSQPHKEADKAEGYAYNDMEHFNSQPHKEADDPVQHHGHRQQCISTHSLTRRLTRSPTKHAQAIIFQLTASQGG